MAEKMRKIATEEAWSIPEVAAPVSEEDRHKLYHRNAERIFPIDSL